MPIMTMLDAIREALTMEMERDERVMVLGQDVGRLGGVFRATDGLQDRFGEQRVVDMPLAEAVIAGSALGLAISGLIPVVEMQFLGFSHQAFHQIGPHIARMRYRSQGRFRVPLTIRAPFGGLVRTPEHHCDAYEAQFAQFPGLKIVMPATAYDAKGLLLASIRDEDPVLFCEPLRGYRLIKGEVPSEDYTVPLGKARIACEGEDVTIIAWSAMVQTAERAAAVLAEEGISAHVLDLRSLVPLDVEGIVAAVERTGRVVIAHEAPLTAGFGAEIVATINDEVFYRLEAPVVRVTAPDTPYPLAGVEDFYVPGVDRLVAAARDLARMAA
ncbi:alpha-ketoacid dehydrogenase subunit beta [Dactylosporangium sp. NPDC051484]|uniref:alpha-ketoacid dehydrogenase subunit beta n=1 Tax=Dactylosporangium sp. NPDC051484 TaxID=3154942 RepID=UPI0034503D56